MPGNSAAPARRGTRANPAAGQPPSSLVLRALLGVGHTAAALAIAYVFVVMLMTAIAQQSVLTQLKARGLETGYSSAYVTSREVAGRLQEIAGLQTQERDLSDDIPARQSATASLRGPYNAAWRAFVPLARRAAGTCRIENLAGADTPESRMALWTEVGQCSVDGSVPASLAAQLAQLRRSGSGFGNVAQRLDEAADAERAAIAELEALRARIRTDSERTTEADVKAWRSFADMNVLHNSWFLGGGVLTPFPPSLLQLLLAFVSGAFGALLVTLVLIVYPANPLHIASASSYFARILLGGLIAVCVYIMLLGGSSVLGSSGGFNGAEANYMAFCAVGILAGMFSDRVAAWLSSRANAFFQNPVAPAAARRRRRRVP